MATRERRQKTTSTKSCDRSIYGEELRDDSDSDIVVTTLKRKHGYEYGGGDENDVKVFTQMGSCSEDERDKGRHRQGQNDRRSKRKDGERLVLRDVGGAREKNDVTISSDSDDGDDSSESESSEDDDFEERPTGSRRRNGNGGDDSRGRQRRGRPRGTTKDTKRRKTAQLRSQKHYKPTEVVKLAKAWVIVSQKKIVSDDAFWKDVEKLCAERFGMKRSCHSLRCKWTAFQRDANLWLTCKARVDKEQVTGNWSKEKRTSMIQTLFTARRVSEEGVAKKGAGSRFKYVEAAEYLSQFPKFKDRPDENPGMEEPSEPTERNEASWGRERWRSERSSKRRTT